MAELMSVARGIQFKNFITYCKTFAGEGDFMVPLHSNINAKEDDPKNIKIYRRLGNNLCTKGTVRDEDVDLYVNKISTYLNSMSRSISNIAESFIVKLYDKHMRDPHCGICITHIWVPLKKVYSDTALVITICNRINIIIT